MLNALTIDVEDYFQVYAFSDVIKFEDWGNYECRIERNVDRLLSILSDSPIKNGSTPARQHGNTLIQQHSSTSAHKYNSELNTHNSKLNDSVHSPQHLKLQHRSIYLLDDTLTHKLIDKYICPC